MKIAPIWRARAQNKDRALLWIETLIDKKKLHTAMLKE